jgi:hypothetical protein
MKTLQRLLYVSIAVCVPWIALASTEQPYQDETPNPEILAMGFDECIEIQHGYERDVGAPQVVLDTPSLRIVMFKNTSENEEIACDGDGNIMSVLNLDDDDD